MIRKIESARKNSSVAITKRRMSELGSELSLTFQILNRSEEEDLDQIFAQLRDRQIQHDHYKQPSDHFESGDFEKTRKSSTSSGSISEAFSPAELNLEINTPSSVDENCQVILFLDEFLLNA